MNAEFLQQMKAVLLALRLRGAKPERVTYEHGKVFATFRLTKGVYLKTLWAYSPATPSTRASFAASAWVNGCKESLLDYGEQVPESGPYYMSNFAERVLQTAQHRLGLSAKSLEITS